MKTTLLAAAAILTITGTASAAPAGKFLGDAIKGDNSEMTLGQLAVKRGGSPAVRTFGQMLHTDHAQAKQQAVAAARREHVAVPSTMMPEAKAEYAKLQRMSGNAFDREFARYMVNDHKKDIAKFEQQAKTGDRIAATLARQTLPTLRKHLAMAKAIRS